MINHRLPLLLTLGFCLAGSLDAQVPQLINYQGRVVVGGTNFNGAGQFKFALVQGAGPTLLWKNDGSGGNTEPAAAVSLAVANGLYSVLLGDATLASMTVIPSTVFNNADVRLRVWFNGGSGFQQLAPDQRIAAVGYAMMAGNVPDGAITGAKLADGAVTSAKLSPGAVGSTALGNSIELGTTNVSGRLDVYRTSANTPGVSIVGSSSSISTYGSDGLEQIRLHGSSWGELLLRNSLPNNATAVNLTAQGSTGGRLSLNNTNGSSRAILEGENTGGTLTLYASDGGIGAILYGNEGQGSGALSLRNTNGSPRFRAYGGPSSGSLQLYDNDGTETVDVNASGNGSIVLRQGDNSTGLALLANNGTGGGGISIYRDDGSFAGQMTIADTTRRDGFWGLTKGNGNWGITARGQNSSTGGGAMYFYDSAGSATVVIDADSADEGRIFTQVLTITGGSDLSESFDINSADDELKSGMIVSIDPANPGELVLCQEAFDKKVAGIISGAGGVKTGMLMSQAGTKADGKHPVALTGRVYCWVDADVGGAIEPGDMITTSGTAGHGMKVTDHSLAAGAIIGKAMTSLTQGKGLVLVLVSLQ